MLARLREIEDLPRAAPREGKAGAAMSIIVNDGATVAQTIGTKADA